MAGRKQRQFTFRATVAQEPMPVEEWQAVERLLARLTARAYAADHPEQFRPTTTPGEVKQDSRPPATAAAEGAAPAPSAGDRDERSMEHGESKTTPG
jgi:hypothetical protein